jgi:hypothetical protein
MDDRISSIRRRCIPPQILKPIVRRIAIGEMTPLLTERTWTDEGPQDNPMNRIGELLVIATEFDLVGVALIRCHVSDKKATDPGTFR